MTGRSNAGMPRPKPARPVNWSIRWLASGERLAACSTNGNVCVWDVPSLKIVSSAYCAMKLNDLAFSSDGRQVVLAGPRLLQARDVERLGVIWTQEDVSREFDSVAISPDRGLVVCTVRPVWHDQPASTPSARRHRVQFSDADGPRAGRKRRPRRLLRGGCLDAGRKAGGIGQSGLAARRGADLGHRNADENGRMEGPKMLCLASLNFRRRQIACYRQPPDHGLGPSQRQAASCMGNA